MVTLDGTASSDPDGDTITYRWTLASRPVGSTAALASAASASPRFLADVAGTYTAVLVVNDGRLDSASASSTIMAVLAPVPPVAEAGVTHGVTVGTLVTLDGSASSDANGDALVYAWTLVARPAASTSEIRLASDPRPTFSPDRAGFYVVALQVSDGRFDSVVDRVTVTASAGAPGQGTWESTLSPRDIDGDGAIDAYYDTTMDITWLADANAAAGTPYDSVPSLINDEPSTATDGLLYHVDATRWVAHLDVHGVSGWRLPSTVDAAGSEAFPPPAGSSEMASMYYVTLASDVSSSSTTGNGGPFANLRSGYWSGTVYSQLPGYPDKMCWNFDFATGRQAGRVCDMARYLGRGKPHAAWAVHDGDVKQGSVP